MRNLAVLLFPVALAAIGAPVQTSTGELESRREAYQAALRGWDRSDSNLSRDLLRFPAEEILPRVGSTARSKADLLQAKAAYLRTMLAYYAGQRAAGASGGWKLSSDLEWLSAQAQADVELATGEADLEIARTPLDERQRALELDGRKAQLEQTAAGVRDLDRKATRSGSAGVPGRDAVLAGTATAAALEAIAKEAAASLEAEARLWAARYSEMRGVVEQRAARAGAVLVPAGMATPAGAEAEAQAVVPTLGGTWFYSNPDAQKKSGSYETVMARARITQTGDEVQGNYDCTFAVPPEEKYSPHVRFAFAGKIRSEIMRFDIQSPLKGWILIQKAGPAKIRVTYHIDNGGSQGISFNDVTDDSPQILDRRLN